jgi:hypothetical protein
MSAKDIYILCVHEKTVGTASNFSLTYRAIKQDIQKHDKDPAGRQSVQIHKLSANQTIRVQYYSISRFRQIISRIELQGPATFPALSKGTPRFVLMEVPMMWLVVARAPRWSTLPKGGTRFRKASKGPTVLMFAHQLFSCLILRVDHPCLTMRYVSRRNRKKGLVRSLYSQLSFPLFPKYLQATGRTTTWQDRLVVEHQTLYGPRLLVSVAQ